ncbi:hypothetical protein BSZ19_21535 [Bradyrhizobium japonicum]|uniref:Uncharacterized protein n=1 Tax=Bradyrhizobium japonicum TaxID=375 RepID=A0A1Y2JMF7_BRAJP|nr:hypothetical protein BSZ19_21535 [Bradyrhizobium japonicum]
MEWIMYNRNAKRIVRDVDPLLAAFVERRRRRALQALNPQPDRAISVTRIALNGGKSCDFVLVKSELGSIGEFVLRQSRCNTLIQLDERLDVIKQARQPPCGQFVFYIYFGGHGERDP